MRGWLVALALVNVGRADAAEPGVAAERFRLALDREGIIGLESAAVPTHGALDLAFWLGYANDPLVVYQTLGAARSRAGDAVGDRVSGGLVVSLAFWERLQLGLEVPLSLHQGGDPLESLGLSLARGSLGWAGPRITPKLQFLRERSHGVSFSVATAVTLPSISRAGFVGNHRPSFEPELLLGRHLGPFRLGAGLGGRFRGATVVAGLEAASELFGQLGASFQPAHLGLGASVVLVGATNAEAPFGDFGQNYLELQGSTQYRWQRLSLEAGAGWGLGGGYGAPDYRVFAAARWSTREDDTDRDRWPDAEDGCPEEPEDWDGWLDADGCPDPDNDGDRVLDRFDGARDEAEDYDGFWDHDGVPDPDNDADGLLDGRDRCPVEVGPPENQGCPDRDRDGDGVADRFDPCPEVPEDPDGFRDEDGCADPDDDRDGVPDGADRCPREAGPVQAQGCPDVDRDRDGLVDRLDSCPDEAGSLGAQGCAAPQRVRITQDRVQILDRVYFDSGKATIQRRSLSLLDEIAAVLLSHLELQKLEVQGHTDNQGSAGLNRRLSLARAAAVREALIVRGVAAERLSAAGYGPDQPIATNRTAAGRATNRRVELLILGAQGERKE